METFSFFVLNRTEANLLIKKDLCDFFIGISNIIVVIWNLSYVRSSDLNSELNLSFSSLTLIPLIAIQRKNSYLTLNSDPSASLERNFK